MTEKTEFSLQVDVSPASGFKPLSDWIAFDLCKPYEAPGGNLLLHNTQNGKRAMVKPDVYASLVGCNTFQTADKHVDNIIEKQPDLQEHRSDVHAVLKQMLNSGIMYSAKHVVDRIKSKPKTTTTTDTESKPVVAIITWERPAALERLLASIAANCVTEKFHSLYVIDDSRKSENISKNQALVTEFSEKMDSRLSYFGQSEQQSFIGELAARLPNQECAIRFLMDQGQWRDHWTSGLARNWAMLVSSGRRVVVLDDDVICDVFEPANRKTNITISSDPRENDFFASEDEWAHLHQAINPDPVDRHMQCLGMSLSGAIEVLGQQHLKPAGLENTTSLQASELQADSPILITECGSLGCPGTTSNTWLPSMDEQSLKKVLASQRKTTLALTKRKVWSGRSHPHFAPHSNMSQITGFDNRAMLPPYLPIARGEDRLFGHMVDFVFPTSVVLDYPWSIPHLPIPDREWQDRDLEFKTGSSFPFFFFEKVLEYKSICQSDKPLDRLEALGGWFRDLGSASCESIAATHRDHSLDKASGGLKHLDTLLASTQSAPVNWQNYLRNGIRKLNIGLDAASLEDFPVKGFPDGFEDNELITFWKDAWVGFGEALIVWPQIRTAAAEIVEAWAID